MGIAAKYLPESQRALIARGLFNVSSEEEGKGEIHGYCPIHQESENSPSPSFSYNFRKDFYHCFSCGADGDLLRLWTEVNGLGQKEGFKAFCDQFAIPFGKRDKGTGGRREGGGGGADSGVAFNNSPVPAPSEKSADLPHELVDEMMNKAWDLFPTLPDAFIRRLEKERGWSRRWIEILDLRLQTHYMNKKGNLTSISMPERVAIPVRDAAGRLLNIRLYAPGKKQFKIVSFAKSTGQARLFPALPFPAHEVALQATIPPPDVSSVGPENMADTKSVLSGPANSHQSPNKEFVLLCEGESDTICALSHGFSAITQTSKLKNWPDDQLTPFKGREVVIAYDADGPGKKYAGFAAQALAGTAKTIRTIQWPSFMGVASNGAVPKDHGQDLTDFFVTHSQTADDLIGLIDAAEIFTPPAASSPASPPGPGDGDLSYLDFFSRGVNDRLSFKSRLLANKILGDLSLLSDPDTGLVYRWNNQYWEPYDEDHVKAIALRYLGLESQKARAEDAAYQVKMLCTLPHGRQVNDQLDWICLKNGMFNLKTFALAPHDREYFCTYALPVAYDPDTDKICERWIRYLKETVQTPEAIDQLQEYMGYILVRHTRYEKCLLLIGPGSDGKSTFLKIMKELVGDENCAAVSFNDLEDQFQRSSLYNKLLNISTEVGAKAIESPYFKAITSGDPINAAFKHKNTFTFSPYCKLAFAANRLPRVLDNSDGFFRRVLPVQFKRQFLDDSPDKDSELFESLKMELSEIFSWAVVGLDRLTTNKRFTSSDETRAMMMDYRRINNPVLCYVEDCCILDTDAETPKADLYDNYRNYCGKNGYTSMSRENFFRELYVAENNLRQHHPYLNGQRTRTIKGIKLSVDPA